MHQYESLEVTGTPRVALTLVALYGPKPPPIAQLLDALQAEVSSQLGDAYTAYDMEQVHGTVIGLEGYRDGADILNSNYARANGAPYPMDLEGLFRFLIKTPLLPLRVRVGGFLPTKSYPFTSRGLHPYIRSFALCGSSVVVMGWPVAGQAFPMSLDALRRRCTDYNVLHKFHTHPSDVDNDFYFVLGCVERDSVSRQQIEVVENHVRQQLAARKPLDIRLGPEQLSVVVYTDTQLPKSSSVYYDLVEAQARVEQLKDLYQDRCADNGDGRAD